MHGVARLQSQHLWKRQEAAHRRQGMRKGVCWQSLLHLLAGAAEKKKCFFWIFETGFHMPQAGVQLTK